MKEELNTLLEEIIFHLDYISDILAPYCSASEQESSGCELLSLPQ